MSKNTIEWKLKALKQVKKFPLKSKEKIFSGVESLYDWPSCKDVKKLQNREGYRLRVGQYRVFFDVNQGKINIITIEEVKKRDSKTY
ncbi:cytotoxic translational repressor of toxin-antitoxin stability system (plasmid) [Piscirickettsia salmonis]|uniref:Cytotoxic translational repressor of toxin-antitoxin stability system n=1 Tax=Piscirickettsia salmonis TaxID=1238 RepID=A0A9Q6LN61_PISSA|nr:type II toxin-antitoxin system RelE/ParE family toxin [Piscirickettsia salmonis]ALA26626.1 cytotoxic translational repressor of toxin-antitoxin stability system [Piscirickettsia salmonis]APS45971.1 cytotoxic translational repressor of toxin-antitoxin stability system [Piscirickettsia salmonis]APS49336.1 cytotoxic translational repressor of toxin-antitoxin stability system [Piscirickettsia salmonis]APS52581.1 cytotoxic translational repressor of toxin-antitoxin stability system [Pisciricketts